MGNSKNAPDERVVYLALKNVFKGSNAEVRQPKVIRKLINNGQDQGDIAGLLESHNIDMISNTACVLLTERIFESTLKAKIRFPEVSMNPRPRAQRGKHPKPRLLGTRQMRSKTLCKDPNRIRLQAYLGQRNVSRLSF